MGVPDYTSIEKIQVDELIQNALHGNAVFYSGAIEHYSLEELQDLAEKANKHNLIITLKAEHSNFYQGVMVSVCKRESVKKYSNYM